MAFSSLAAFVLSRFAFVATHVAFAIWGTRSFRVPLSERVPWLRVTFSFAPLERAGNAWQGRPLIGPLASIRRFFSFFLRLRR